MENVFLCRASGDGDLLVSPCPSSLETRKQKVIKIMIAQGVVYFNVHGGGATASVAYVLLENGKVLVFGSPDVTAPYSAEQAKILMMADLGQDVYIVKK